MPTDSLDWDQCVAAMSALEGREVAVRIALRHRNEGLVAVFHGRLGALTRDGKQPSLFWSLGPSDGHPEQPGIYLRAEQFVGAQRRAGGILVIEQQDVVLNLRPLDVAAGRLS